MQLKKDDEVVTRIKYVYQHSDRYHVNLHGIPAAVTTISLPTFKLLPVIVNIEPPD